MVPRGFEKDQAEFITSAAVLYFIVAARAIVAAPALRNLM
jgi:hypothetical protein